MALKEIQEKATYINVSSEGHLLKVVDEKTPGAIRRDWESADKKSKGTKWEKHYHEISGMITSIEFYEGDFGTNVIFGIKDGNEPEIKLSFGVKSQYGEDILKKIPSIDKTKSVIIRPYNFVGDNGKSSKGVTILQDGNKIKNFFYDSNEKVNLNGYPDYPSKIDKKTGLAKPLSKGEQEIYFKQAAQYVIDYLEDNDYVFKSEVKETKKEKTLDEVVASMKSEDDSSIPF